MNLIAKIYFLYVKRTKKQKVYIPAWIKEITADAFDDNCNIKEIHINKSVHTIESKAFSRCQNLVKVYFYGNVENISYNAFPLNNSIKFYFANSIDEKEKQRIRDIVKSSQDSHKDSYSFSSVLNNNCDVSKEKSTENTICTNVPSVEPECEESSELFEMLSDNAVINENQSEYNPEIETLFGNQGEYVEINVETDNDSTACKLYEDEELSKDILTRNVQDDCCCEYEEVTQNSDAEDGLDEFVQPEEIADDINEEIVTDIIICTDEDMQIDDTNQSENVNSDEIEESVTVDFSENPINKSQDLSDDDEQSDCYDEIVLQKVEHNTQKITSESKSEKIKVDIKDDMRKQDHKKYASNVSVLDAKSSDPFICALIEKYVALLNKYGNELPIGMIDMTKEEYEKLAGYAFGYISTDSPMTSITAFICSVFLVKTLANYDHNNNLWGSVATLLKSDENTVAVYLRKALLSFCSTERLYFHYYKNRHSYARTAMIHSIINRSTLSSTIDFIRDFYIEEMHESYDPVTVHDYIELFVCEMVKDLKKSSEETDDTNDIVGLYRVSSAFKTACKEFPSAVKEGLKCLLFNIDAYYHRTSDVSYYPAIFNKYFKRWKINDVMRKRINNKMTEQKSSAQKRNFACTAEQLERFSKMERCTYFIDENYKLYLYIPCQSVPVDYAQESIYVRLFDNNESIPEYNVECDVIGMFRFHTGEIQIELGKLYRDLSVRIVTEKGDIIFDSKTQLYRKHIVFDVNLDEYVSRNIPKERFYILCNKDDEFFADANYNSYKYGNYVIHSLDVEGECDLLVNGHDVFESATDLTDIKLRVDTSYLIKRVKAVAWGKEYRVYSSVPKIHCIAEKDTDKYMIDINDRHIGVDEILGNASEVDLDLRKFIDDHNMNFISISLRERGSRKNLCEWRIAVFEDFEYSLDKPYYYMDKSVQLLDLYASNADFEIEDYPCVFSINNSRNITVNGVADNIAFYINIRLPMIYWEFDEKYNSLSGAKYISSSVLRKNSNMILDLQIEDCEVWAINENVVRKMTITNGRMNLSDFIASASDYTTVGVRGSIVGDIKLFELIHKPAVRELSVFCNDNELVISYVKIGVCPMNISIANDNGKKVFARSYSSQQDDDVYISEDISQLADGIYTITVSQIVSDGFGFSTEMKTVGVFKITKGNAFEVYCRSKSGMLKPEYCIFDEKTKKHINNFYCENVETSADKAGVYTASAFYHNKYGDRVYFKDANPINIELLEKNDDVITFTVTDREYDGFLYEKARGYLCSDKQGSHDYSAYSLPDYYSIRI